MHYLRWSRCAVALRSGVCPCRQQPRGLCRLAAICMDSPSHRTARSRSEETTFSRDGHFCFPQRTVALDSHRSSRPSSVSAGCITRTPRWGASAWPCPRSCHIWGGSSAGCHHLLLSESVGEHERGHFTTKAEVTAACREAVTYPPIFGFNDDFVTFELLDFNLDVGFFFIRDPGSFLTWHTAERMLGNSIKFQVN